MPVPGQEPIAKTLWSTVSAISRAFEETLAEAGGSRSTWFILLSLKSRPVANQRELAAEIGIQGATLTHHLTAMEEAGWLVRRRDPANRRVHLVELTDAGESAFQKLKEAAIVFDRKLRQHVPDEEMQRLRSTLAKLRANVTGES